MLRYVMLYYVMTQGSSPLVSHQYILQAETHSFPSLLLLFLLLPLLRLTWIADSVAVSVAFSCLSRDTATATRMAPAAFKISTDSLIAVPAQR